MEPLKEKILHMANDRGEFVTGSDGYVYWWPESKGYLSSVELRILADELDERNREWEKQIDDYFRSGD